MEQRNKTFKSCFTPWPLIHWNPTNLAITLLDSTYIHSLWQGSSSPYILISLLTLCIVLTHYASSVQSTQAVGEALRLVSCSNSNRSVEWSADINNWNLSCRFFFKQFFFTSSQTCELLNQRVYLCHRV